MRLLSVLVLALLLVPGAGAASVEGLLLFPQGVLAEGEVDLSSSWGVLDLTQAAQASRRVHLQAVSAEGYLVTRENEFVGYGESGAQTGPVRFENESVVIGSGALEGIRCSLGCTVLLFAEGPEGKVGVMGRASGALGVVAEARVYARGISSEPARDSFYYRVEPGWVAATVGRAGPGAPMPLGGGEAHASGRLALYVQDAVLQWRTENGTQTIDLTNRTRPHEDALGQASLKQWVGQRHMLLHLSGASLAAEPGLEAVLMGTDATLRVEGTVRAPAANGHLLVGGNRFDVSDEAVDLRGAFVSAPEPQVPFAAGGPLALDAFVGFPVEGEATRIAIGGRLVDISARRVEATTAATMTGLSLATLLLGAALYAKSGAAASLYMRVRGTTLLRNDNRRLVYETVRAQPGVTLAELVRTTGLTQVVVRHHLRMLEAHLYVVIRGEGRLRCCFAMDARADPESTSLHMVLKDATRRRIAEILVRSPMPLTQAALSEAAGVSRRLVSHHLARLEEAGLVEGSGGTPRGYVPSVALVRFLEGGALAAT